MNKESEESKSKQRGSTSKDDPKDEQTHKGKTTKHKRGSPERLKLQNRINKRNAIG
jgi:hypothetical protein